MKIKDIRAIPLRIPLKEPFHMAHFTVRFMHYVLIIVETDIGIQGYGEATPAWEVNGETCDSIAGYINLLKNKKMTGYSIIGESIDSLEIVEKLIDRIINPIHSAELIAGNTAAKAGLEQALYYAFCEYKQQPFLDLYKIKSQPIPCSTTISIADIDTTLQMVRQSIKKNASVIRLKIGKKDAYGKEYSRDITVIKETKQIIKSQNRKIKLAADANQAFEDIISVVNFCKEIKDCLDWLEQPLAANDLFAFKEIKKYCDIPLMADESFTSFRDAHVLLKSGGIDFLNVKLMKVGGLRGALAIIDIANTYNVKSYIGSMIESGLGIAMGGLTYLSRPEVIGTDLNVYSLLEGQISTGIKIEKNTIQLNDEYGLGSQFLPDKINDYKFG